MTSAARSRRLPRIRGVIGVRKTMVRGRTRTTRKPSIVSSMGKAGSCRVVTTVTSCPRRASSRERVRTWLSTPPKWGENQGDTWAIFTPVPSEDPASGRDVAAGVGARAEERFLADDRARVDGRVDAHLHVVPHDHPELSEARIDFDPAEHDLHRGLVESEIRDLRARPQVAPLAEDAVADIVLVGHVGGRHEDRVLHLAGVADFRLRPNRGRRSDVAVGADLRIRADDCRAFDVGAPADGRSLLHQDLADQGRTGVQVPVVRPFQWRQQGRVRPQEIPRPPDVDPFAGQAEAIHLPFRHEHADRVRNFVLAAGRFRRRIDEREDILVEDVDARVDEIGLRLPRFLLQGGDLTVLHLHDPEGARIRDLGQGHDWTSDLLMEREKLGESRGRCDHTPVDAQERAIDVLAHASDCMGGSQPLSLLFVFEREAEGLAVPEPLADPMALPSDEDRNLSDSGRAEGLQRVPQERLAGHWQKGLRKIRREGPNPRALSGCEDDGLHAAAPFALDRTAEYISFALASSRDSARTRIFGSVPENRTSAQPSSNCNRQPSTVLTSAPESRSARSRRVSMAARSDAG